MVLRSLPLGFTRLNIWKHLTFIESTFYEGYVKYNQMNWIIIWTFTKILEEVQNRAPFSFLTNSIATAQGYRTTACGVYGVSTVDSWWYRRGVSLRLRVSLKGSQAPRLHTPVRSAQLPRSAFLLIAGRLATLASISAVALVLDLHMAMATTVRAVRLAVIFSAWYSFGWVFTGPVEHHCCTKTWEWTRGREISHGRRCLLWSLSPPRSCYPLKTPSHTFTVGSCCTALSFAQPPAITLHCAEQSFSCTHFFPFIFLAVILITNFKFMPFLFSKKHEIWVLIYWVSVLLVLIYISYIPFGRIDYEFLLAELHLKY